MDAIQNVFDWLDTVSAIVLCLAWFAIALALAGVAVLCGWFGARTKHQKEN
jgi:hypothetical protein